MRRFNEVNERVKRAYIVYLREAKGQDEKSIDKVLAALVRFEESTGYKPFKKFHIEQAGRFKAHLAKARNGRTKKPLSHATIDATLRLVKAFFHWLAGQPGYKSVLSYDDCEYFNNNAKNARVAHAERDAPYPSMGQARRAFDAMPEMNVIERRNKAFFAFLVLTGARNGAATSLKLKHIDVAEREVFQDARDVKTKNAKMIYTWFFPVDAVYLDCLGAWVGFLKDDLAFGPDDALFPKPEMRRVEGKGFQVFGLSREPYAGAGKLNEAIRDAFAAVHMHEYTVHGFRKTLGMYANEVCTTLEEFKAWSMNLGHENLATTVSSYMPVTRHRQRDLIRALGKAA